MGEKRYISLKVQMRKLNKKVNFLAVPNLAKYVTLGTAFFGKYIEQISPKANNITLMSSIPIAIVSQTCRDPS